MRPLARELLEARDGATPRLVYGTATAQNTVRLDGESTAVVLPAIIPVETGDRAAVLKSGGDRVIVGPIAVTQTMAAGFTTATTDENGIVTVTHGLPFTPVGVVGTPHTTNHGQCIVNNYTATTFRYRAFTIFGDPRASASISFSWIAFK